MGTKKLRNNRNNRKRTKQRKHRKKHRMNGNRFKNCKDVKEVNDAKMCRDNYNYMDDEPIDEDNPQNYYALSAHSGDPYCITKTNYLSLPIKYDQQQDIYYRENPFTNEKIRCNETEEFNNYFRRDVYRNEGSYTYYYTSPSRLIYSVYSYIRNINSEYDTQAALFLIKTNNVNLNQNFFMKDYLKYLKDNENITPRTLFFFETKFKFLTLFQAILLFRRKSLLEELYKEYPHLNVKTYHMLLEQDLQGEYNVTVDDVDAQSYMNVLSFLFYDIFSNNNRENDKIKINMLKLIKHNTSNYDFEELLDSQELKRELMNNEDRYELDYKKQKINDLIEEYRQPLQPIITKYERRMTAMRSGRQNEINPDTGELYFPKLTEDELELKNFMDQQIKPLQENLNTIIKKYEYAISPKPLKTLKIYSNNSSQTEDKLLSYMQSFNIDTDVIFNIDDLIYLFDDPKPLSLTENKSIVRSKILRNIINDIIENNIENDDTEPVRKLISTIIRYFHLDGIYVLFSFSDKILKMVKENTIKDRSIKYLQIKNMNVKPNWEDVNGNVYSNQDAIDNIIAVNDLVRVFNITLITDSQSFYEGFIKASIMKIQDIQIYNQNIYIKEYRRNKFSILFSSNDEFLFKKALKLEKEAIDFLKYIIDNTQEVDTDYDYSKFFMRNVLLRDNPVYPIRPELHRPLPYPKKTTSMEEYTSEGRRVITVDISPYTTQGKRELDNEFKNNGKVYAFTHYSGLLISIFNTIQNKENFQFEDVCKYILIAFLVNFLPKETTEEEIYKLRKLKKVDIIQELAFRMYSYSNSDQNIYKQFLDEGMKQTAGDGDCLFHSLRGLIMDHYSYNIDVYNLRLMVVETLRRMVEVGDILPNILIESANASTNNRFTRVETYLNYMKTPRKWAGELEIRSAAVLLNRNIELKLESNNSTIMFEPKSKLNNTPRNNNPLVLYHVMIGSKRFGNHYQYKGYNGPKETINPLFINMLDYINDLEEGDINKLKVAQLKNILGNFGLSQNGIKKELIKRILEYELSHPEIRDKIKDELNGTKKQKTINYVVKDDKLVVSNESDVILINYPDRSIDNVSSKLFNFFSYTNEDNKIFVSESILNKLTVKDLETLCELYQLSDCFKGQRLKQDKIKNILKLLRERDNIQDMTESLNDMNINTSRRSTRSTRQRVNYTE